jgi:predicted nucleic acid-binding Zn finger protein
MAHTNKNFFHALHKRIENSKEVIETYSTEYVGAQSWIVINPDEYDRCYLVDMIKHSCNCPDFQCQTTDNKLDCKHILAVEQSWRDMGFIKEVVVKEPPRVVFIPKYEDDPFTDPDDKGRTYGKAISWKDDE